MGAVSSPPALATIHVTEDARGLFVRIECRDVHVRRGLIDSFRQTFHPHGRRYSKPLRPGWSLPSYTRARLIAWLSTEHVDVLWPEEVN